MTLDPTRSLQLKVHGRVLEHLGIQMYESPVNAIAELIANAWDADAELVEISLPNSIDANAEIRVRDNGIGMSPKECQERYLYVGWNRRGDEPTSKSPEKKRQVLGRKGIGKFAGFGIAQVIRIESVSKETGEKTVFELSLDDLMGQEYVGPGSKTIDVLEYLPPSDDRKVVHGTTIILKNLRLSRRIRSDFPRSMARRFILLQRQADFTVKVDGNPLPSAVELDQAQYIFPRDYRDADRPVGLLRHDGSATGESNSSEGWGTEKVGDRLIRWRFMFHKDTISEEELRGITVYANGKLVQSPFLFQLTGGLSGQHGIEYLTGQVEADYLDLMDEDVVTTERQRVNWHHSSVEPLLHWGQQRIRTLLSLWKEMRGEERRRQIEEKLAAFSARLEKLPLHERTTVRQALTKIGSISTLSDEQFSSLSSAILTAWEQGRLASLINDIAESDALSEHDLLGLFAEMDVLTALNVAEAIRTRILAVGELKRRVEKKELENPLRDFIAEHPYLLAPEYETFKRERSLKGFLDEMNAKANMPGGSERKRVDLLLSNASELVLFEFMRPRQFDRLGSHTKV